ncbi:class I SAM-dependent methyltransferase [Streptomyces sp. MNP-20]|uniref:class I SAM-dependent DNA methyltransferase n=1 Tax=Streptomyces sp. MNP-20 TaxID=2721165 RepID=UPI00155375A9|nr:class I SAM-dependent methyltransferase [Streptomyces sp. MNP-20]
MTDSYAELARYYDLIMASGYYDYDAYARELVAGIGERRDVLELGVGTGLVCERLLELARAGLRLTGIDHTQGMLDRARARLGDRVRLIDQDIVSAAWGPAFDVAYSVGGVWLWLVDQDGAHLGSHLLRDDENTAGLERLAAALRPGGLLLLSVQEAHRSSERSLPGGLRYVQHVQDGGDGRIVKDYFVLRDDTVLAHQHSTYRLFPEEEAGRLLARAGFRPRPGPGTGALFRQYART